MRKSILFSFVVALALAGVASAYSTGPGGTIYWTAVDVTNHRIDLYYLDVDSSWTATAGTTGAVVKFGSIAVDSAAAAGSTPSSNTANARSLWYNPATGKMDMAGQYHNGYLILAGNYNNTIQGSTGSGVTRGQDYLRVNPDGTVTLLMDGWNGDVSGGASQTSQSTIGITAVDSNFTATASQSGWSIANIGGLSWGPTTQQGIYSDTDGNAGTTVYDAYASPSTRPFWPEYRSGAGAYTVADSSKYAVGGQGVTGALYAASWGNVGGVFKGTFYRPGTGTYASALTYSSDINANIAANYGENASANAMVFAVGDTNGNGIPDVYYRGATGNFMRGHDENNDGDFADGVLGGASLDEVTDIGLACGGFVKGIQLFQNPDNSWVLLTWTADPGTNGGAGAYLNLFGLNAAGNYDGTSKTIVYETTNNSGFHLSGDVSVRDLYQPSSAVSSNASESYYSVAQFIPLGQPVPEPGTVLLVGTGVLGLAGVLRRRLLS